MALHVFTHIHINALYTAFTDFMATLNWLLLGLGYRVLEFFPTMLLGTALNSIL